MLKRAEDAESILKLVAEELSGLKRQVNAMTFAVFGKYSWQGICNIHLARCRVKYEILKPLQGAALLIWAQMYA